MYEKIYVGYFDDPEAEFSVSVIAKTKICVPTIL